MIYIIFFVGKFPIHDIKRDWLLFLYYFFFSISNSAVHEETLSTTHNLLLLFYHQQHSIDTVVFPKQKSANILIILGLCINKYLLLHIYSFFFIQKFKWDERKYNFFCLKKIPICIKEDDNKSESGTCLDFKNPIVRLMFHIWWTLPFI